MGTNGSWGARNVGAGTRKETSLGAETRMRSFRFSGLVGALCASSVCASGCVSQEQCQKPVGQYHAAYSVVDGNCSPPLMRDLDLEQDADQTTGTTVDDLSDSVTTEVSLVGCTIGLRQDVADRMKKIPKSKLTGNLQVKDAEASAMEGMMLYQEFMQDGTTLR